jgi:hypothetical protein
MNKLLPAFAGSRENDGIFLAEILPRRRERAFQIVANFTITR